jgi:hypothetical protein
MQASRKRGWGRIRATQPLLVALVALCVASVVAVSPPPAAAASTAQVSVYDGNHGTLLPGTLRRVTGEGPTGDAVVDGAFDNVTTYLDCLQDVFGRNSVDGLGAPIAATVHYYRDYCNAYWDSTQLVLGDGDATVGCGQFALSLDAISNALSSALVENTAGLNFSGQPGAITVATWDILTAVCQWYADGSVTSADTWNIGEDVLPPGLRYMADPQRDGVSLDNIRNYGGQDVHYTAGIIDNAFYLLSEGGTNRTSGLEVTGIGIAKAAQIWYATLTNYLSANSTFLNAREGALQAATDLYGDDSTEYRTVCSAFAAVGIGTTCETATPTPTVTPTETPAPTSTPTATSTATSTPRPTNTATNTPSPTSTPTPRPPKCADVNGTGVVTLSDVAAILLHVGRRQGDPGFQPKYDLDRNGSINIIDVSIALSQFGRRCTQ